MRVFNLIVISTDSFAVKINNIFELLTRYVRFKRNFKKNLCLITGIEMKL